MQVEERGVNESPMAMAVVVVVMMMMLGGSRIRREREARQQPETNSTRQSRARMGSAPPKMADAAVWESVCVPEIALLAPGVVCPHHQHWCRGKSPGRLMSTV